MPFRLAMMRTHLIGEEASELALGLANNDPVAVLDALCDLEYVIQGLAVVTGIRTGGFEDSQPLGGPYENWNSVLRYLYLHNANVLVEYGSEQLLAGRIAIMMESIHSGVGLLGIGHRTFLEAFDEVHRSNMSKLDESGKPLLGVGGRVLKSERYRKPELARFVEGVVV